MRIIQCEEEKFKRDFMPMIIRLWCGDKCDVKNEQLNIWLNRKIHACFEDFAVAACAYTEDDKPIGYLWYKQDMGVEDIFFNGKAAQILQFGIDDQYQRKGFGRQLLKDTCKKIKANGGECLFSDTYTTKWNSMEFYIKCGFIPVAVLPGKSNGCDVSQAFLYRRL